MSSWIRVWDRSPAPAMRLFCLPYAGGSASLYRRWGEVLAGVAEVAAVQLPGRENRIGEPPLSDMPTLVDRLVDAIDPMLDRPFAFFGYSMGARVAHAVTVALRHTGRPAPERLFVAASPGPACTPGPAVHHLPEPELIEHLRRLGGTPEEFFASAELRSLALPALRADLAVVETAEHPPRPLLTCPVRAFAGELDAEASPERMAAWAQESVREFALTTFPAGHFFGHTHLAAMQELVRADLAGPARRARPTADLVGGRL